MSDRQWNSTLPRPKKRMKTGGRLKSTNPERRKKREDRYQILLRKARAGAGYKEAKARAGGQCEQLRIYPVRGEQRCQFRGRLHGHHKTYARFGGNELPEDYLFVCPDCDHVLESQLRPWNIGRQFA